MKSLIFLSFIILTINAQTTFLDPAIFTYLDSTMPKCFNLDNINVLNIQRVPSLFSKKYDITLASLGRCGFYAIGDTKVEWNNPPSSAPTIWTYTLNFTKGDCRPYGGESINVAARNITNRVWLPIELNCAYYIVVGNKDSVAQTFSISRTSAVGLFIPVLMMIITFGILI